MLVRRADSDDPIATERKALVEQRAALEELRRQLGERVAAVKQREDELRAAIARVASGKEPGIALPPQASPDAERLAARVAALAGRERALAARESALAAGHGNGDSSARAATLQAQTRELEQRAAELAARERVVAEREADPDAARLAAIQARVDVLREAEEAFLRTRRELADRSDAVSARERLVAQRERELDEREDAWGGPDMHELEARLRKLETGGPTRRTGTFSGGFKKLAEEGTRRPPDAG